MMWMLFDFGVSVTCVCVLRLDLLERAPFLQQKGVDLKIYNSCYLDFQNDKMIIAER